ncbi:MAG TPA: metallophosphoesterase family protein [Abditibacteriaceae bacterium]|nr:metallophosphoesterase family protein [Abditibacteriaceae bacterium]
MRFLILSDIHGNRFGLESVLADADGEYDTLLCLGDVVGYGAHPNECCEMLCEHNAVSLSGNHDAAALGLLRVEWFNPVAKAAILWTRAQLSEENRDWLRTLPAQQDWPEYDFQTVHGSLREPWEEYITGKVTAQPTFSLMQRSLCFFGHTHVAVCYRCLDVPGERYQMEGAGLPEGGSIEIEARWKYLINPGSCGQPRDGNPQARYALFDSDSRHIEVRAIDYDWDAARQAILTAGLPQVLGDRLLQGR